MLLLEAAKKLEISLAPQVYLMKYERGGKLETRNQNPKPETRNPKLIISIYSSLNLQKMKKISTFALAVSLLLSNSLF